MIDAKDVRFALWLMPGLGDDPTEGVTQLANEMITGGAVSVSASTTSQVKTTGRRVSERSHDSLRANASRRSGYAFKMNASASVAAFSR